MQIDLNYIPYYAEHKIALYLTPTTERILIGPEQDIRTILSGGHSDVYYDHLAPLGTLLMHQTCDTGWEEALAEIDKAHSIMIDPIKDLYMSPRPHEEIARKIFEQKRETQNPLYMFAANRIWGGYWSTKDQRKKKQYDAHMADARTLIKPFAQEWFHATHGARILVDPAILDATATLQAEDETIVTGVNNGVPTEYIIASRSILPLIRYYARKLETWKAYSVKCKICGNYFIATTLKNKMCSDACKQTAKIGSKKKWLDDPMKRRHNSRSTDGNKYWNGFIEKAKKSPEWSEDEILQFIIEKEHYQERKKIKSKDFIAKRISFDDYNNWNYRQEAYAQELFIQHLRNLGQYED